VEITRRDPEQRKGRIASGDVMRNYLSAPATTGGRGGLFIGILKQ
jgi:hypothetical protein